MAKPKKYTLPHGEGSFYYRERDGRWVGVIEAGTSARGTRRRITVTDKDKARAWDKLTARRKQITLEGVTPEGVRAGASVESWLTEWINQRRLEVRPKTYATDKSIVQKWLIPTLGRRKLDQLTPADVRAIAVAVEKGGASPTTQRYAQRILLQALKVAATEGHSVPERVFLTKKTSTGVSDRTAIPMDDAVKLLQAALVRPDASRWVAAFLQGLRQSEALGLTWECVDLDRQLIRIEWQLQELRYADRDRETFIVKPGLPLRRIWGPYHLTPPKTKQGFRIIPIVPWLQAQLEALNEQPHSPTGLVWPNPSLPDQPTTHRMDRRAWREIQDAAGVYREVSTSGAVKYYRVHEIRHTTATLLLAAGVDPEVIKSILGHSDIATTQGYQHVSVDMARSALTRIAEGLALPQIGG